MKIQLKQFIRSQPEDFSNERKAGRFSLYRRLSGFLLVVTVILGIGAIAALSFALLIIALFLALGASLTGIISFTFYLVSGADTTSLPWLQNSQWSIMNRNGNDRHEDH